MPLRSCWQSLAVSRRRDIDRAVLALAGLVLVSIAARFALSHDVDAPWIAPDEQLYGLLGRSLVSGEGLSLLGEPVAYYSLLYPLLVGIPFLWSELDAGVRWVQLLQAVVMSLTAVPVFLWARPLTGGRWALVAAGLTVLMPGLVYSGLFMSEALYFFVAVLAVWVLALCLEKPTLARQALLLGAIGVALVTRLQAVGFVAVLVVAVAVLAVSERTTAPFRRLLPTFSVLGLMAVAWIAVRVVQGGVGELLGGYAPLAQADEYSFGDVAQSLAWQTGAVALITLGVPVAALGILAWQSVRGRELDRSVRVLVATALAYAVVTVVEVGSFASRFVEHVTERQLLSVAPPIFVAFAVWLARGAPRPQPSSSIIALLVAASALLLPLDRVTRLAAYADAPSMIPLERLRSNLDASTFDAVYAVVLAALLLLAMLLPRRAMPAVVVAVALALGGASLVASLEIRDRSHVERERTFAGVATDWIDTSGEQDVTLLLTGERQWPDAWELMFWNESITGVARLAGVESPGVMPQDVVVPREDGRLVTRDGDQFEPGAAVSPAGTSIIGEEIATLPASFEQPGLALYRVEPPLRLSRRIVGLRPNGDLHGTETARIRVFACGPGRLELTLLGKEGRSTRILRDGEVVAERAIQPGSVWRPSIPAPSHADGSRHCDYLLETDGLIGSTRIDFVRTG
jgi:hypothetical protein